MKQHPGAYPGDTVMHVKPVYALLAILGLVVPYYFFIRFLLENGFDIALFAGQLFATEISTFLVADVVISALAVLTFVLTDGPQKNVHPLWLPALGTLVVGPSFGLPCYLYLRETAWWEG
jgi:hypothetical protein